MVFVVNIIFALLGFAAAQFACLRLDIERKIAFIISVLIGVVVYFANFASHVVK